jgi:transketolase
MVFIAYGYMVNQCLDVAQELEKIGIYAGVLNMHTIKPLDIEAIQEAASYTGNIVVVEEHQIATGLGEMVARVLLENNISCRFTSIGVEDRFGRTAKSQEELWKVYGLDKGSIFTRAKNLLGVSK